MIRHEQVRKRAWNAFDDQCRSYEVTPLRQNLIDRSAADFIVDTMRQRWLFAVTSLATIGVAILFLLPDRIIAHDTDLDEGVYLMVARLLHRGYDTKLFFFDQFWLFPKIIASTFGLFGETLVVARLTVFAFSVVGLVGVAAITWQLGGRWIAALSAILIGAIDPLYIRGSRMALADVPAMACIVWALVFIFLFQKDRRRVWIALSGFCAGLSMVLKPFVIGFVVTILIVLLGQRVRGGSGRLKFDRAVLGDLLLFGAIAVITTAPFVDLLHPIQEYQRVIGFHWAERNWMIKRVDDRWRGLVRFARLNVPLLVFAISGIARLRPLTKSLMALLVGEVLTIAILLEMPPWVHHYILILPPLFIFAVLGFGRGLVTLKQFVTQIRTERRLAHNWPAILFAGAVLISLVDLPWSFRFAYRSRCPQPLRLVSVVQYVEQKFRPNEYLISDDALVLFLANRLMPPSAINFTFGDVLKSKFDPAAFGRFEQLVRDNNVAGVVVTSRFVRNPRLISWLETNFSTSVRVGSEQNKELAARVFTQQTKTR